MTRGGLAMKLAAGEKMASICVCDEPAKMRSDPANPFGAGVVLTDEELSAAKAEQDGGGDAGSGDAFLTEKEAIGAETVDGEGDEVRRPRSAGEFFTDARVAEALAREVCVGRFCYSPGLGWLSWTGKRWGVCSDEKVVEAVRAWVVIKVIECLDKGRLPGDVIHDGWKKMLGIRKIKDALALAKGIVLVEAHEFDADPDVLNTADGLVDLRTGQIKTHSPDMLVTKITSGGYRPGFTHEDWDTALRALPDGETRKYFQNRVGQAITGHRSPDGINMILQGGGENGKGVLVSDGLVPALGDYAAPASEKLIAGSMNDHSEEKADLRGQRLIVAEELTEDRVLNVTAIKRISDIATIKARHVYQRNMKFKTTHSLLATSNYRPVVNETDWGTWRRLELWFFPYTFCKSEAECIRPEDRVGDPGLKRRIENNQAHQHDAIVAWAVEGAMRWYAEGAAALRPSAWVQRYTKEWRRQADRIDGFWADRLIATEDEQIERCIPQMDLLDAFNDWLKSNGHRAWTKETFNQRFGSHRVTTEHKVEQKRVREPKSADRYLGFGAPEKLPDMVRVWVGVRFRTRKDDAAEEMAERGMSVVESENESSEDDESGDVFASSS
jgi:P4 family phage/plasmid primase-like protien